MEIAASCPWATAQMMFFGPQAASPPKKTPGRAAGHDLDVAAAQPARGAAAVHRGVADPDDQDPLADLVDVLERDRFQPVDPDVDVGARLGASREHQILAARGPAADEGCVET